VKEVFHTGSALETRAVGRKFAAELSCGAVVALSGELGAGKTEFMRGWLSFWLRGAAFKPDFSHYEYLQWRASGRRGEHPSF